MWRFTAFISLSCVIVGLVNSWVMVWSRRGLGQCMSDSLVNKGREQRVENWSQTRPKTWSIAFQKSEWQLADQFVCSMWTISVSLKCLLIDWYFWLKELSVRARQGSSRADIYLKGWWFYMKFFMSLELLRRLGLFKNRLWEGIW